MANQNYIRHELLGLWLVVLVIILLALPAVRSLVNTLQNKMVQSIEGSVKR